MASRHSLWGHRLWNASLYLADLFDANPTFCKDKNVLELGAGAGLPSLVCALQGARKVIITDYGTSVDNDLITIIQRNIDMLVLEQGVVENNILYAKPHVWGYPVDDLVKPIDLNTEEIITNTKKAKVGELVDVIAATDVFDHILVADCIFNRSEHEKLLRTIKRCLKKDTGIAWVTFSHHDPSKAHLDLNFFKLALSEPFNFHIKHIETVQMVDLFIENDGLDAIRGQVHIYQLRVQSQRNESNSNTNSNLNFSESDTFDFIQEYKSPVTISKFLLKEDNSFH